MAGKRIRRKKGGFRRWLGVMVCMVTLAAVSVPEVPAQERPVPVKRRAEVVLPSQAPGAGPVLAAAAAPTQPAEELEHVEGLEPAGEPAPPEALPLPDTYFSDAAFVGDSRTEGLFLYSGLKEGECLAAVGATVSSVFTKETQETEGGKRPILDVLTGLEPERVYVMLGVNELGWFRPEDFIGQYAKVLDRIREDHPDAEIAVESILPVSAAQDEKHSYVNNDRIDLYNGLLRDLAQEKGCVYLDVASAVAGEDGRLPGEWTFDGVHLNVAGCQRWLEYLRMNPV